MRNRPRRARASIGRRLAPRHGAEQRGDGDRDGLRGDRVPIGHAGSRGVTERPAPPLDEANRSLGSYWTDLEQEPEQASDCGTTPTHLWGIPAPSSGNAALAREVIPPQEGIRGRRTGAHRTGGARPVTASPPWDGERVLRARSGRSPTARRHPAGERPQGHSRSGHRGRSTPGYGRRPLSTGTRNRRRSCCAR